ncbi:hydroxycarboxylic acid receptor 3-like [Myxocyprinus asiaticus]|uniref:hydroxycarboxylic acid receptor 3-like n=1 Tax=Myxocyprinus asiaticus TaxID=70543 RepID=UPI00222334E9|nr:hydroxycarboxylic acid receptor 3-like [Myxocyprinus asiaticus]
MNYSTVNSTTPNASMFISVQMCLFSINFLFGLPTHSYISWLILTGTRSGVASGYFNLNLSICEIVNCLNCMLDIIKIWFPNLPMATMFLYGLAITGRPLFQCLICVERYLAVVHPVTFLKYKPLRYRVICSTAAWIICIGPCLLNMLILASKNIYAQTWFLLMQFLPFLSIQLFFLLAVLRVLKQSGPGERGREREEENHMKRRAFCLILITTVNMVIIYVPYIITGLFFILTQQFLLAPWATSLICYVLAGFVQPVLYLHQAGKLSCLCSS